MKWAKKIVCQWFHGGGTIERDEYGRINWRCSTCGRWSDDPVPLKAEQKLIDRDIDAVAAIRSRARSHSKEGT